MNVGITFPTRSRATKVERLVTSIKPIDANHTVTFVLGFDDDDPQRAKYNALIEAHQNDQLRFVTVPMPRPWRGMGVAFNRLCKHLPPDVETIAMFGDDMVFKSSSKAVFDYIENKIQSWGPDFLGCVVFNDATWNFNPKRLKQGPPIAINGFLHRNWLEALGHFFPDQILGDFADNYITELCLAIKRYDVCHKMVIKHLHQDFHPNQKDKTGDNKRKWERSVGYGGGQNVWNNIIKPRLKGDIQKLREYMERKNA